MGISGGNQEARAPTVPGYNLGESFSQSSGGSNASSTNINYGSNVWNPQQAYLKSLWGSALNQSRDRGAQNQASGMLGDAYGAARQGLNPDWLNMTRNTVGQLQNPNMPEFLQRNNPQLGAYANQIGREFMQNIMPGLKQDAILGGGLGGSRDQIAQAVAGSQVGQQIQDFAAQVYGQDQDRRLGAYNAAQGLKMDAAELGANIFGTAGGMMPQLASLGMQIPWAGLNQLSNILGSPVMQDLGGKQESTSSSHESSKSYSYDIGKTQSGGGGGGGWNAGVYLW